MKLPVIVDPRYHDAVLFDLDGVVTDTASIHARAWTAIFDEFLAGRPPHDGENHAPFTDDDYRSFIDGKPRYDGVADFLASRGVIGPDEFHSGYLGRVYDGIDNNAYTNVMAVWVVVRALEALELLPLRDRLMLLEALDIGTDDLATWDEVSRRMFVPFHDGVINQFEGYEHLAELD